LQIAADERLQRLAEFFFYFGYDEGAEMDLLASEDADALGWEGMEAYQDGDV